MRVSRIRQGSGYIVYPDIIVEREVPDAAYACGAMAVDWTENGVVRDERLHSGLSAMVLQRWCQLCDRPMPMGYSGITTRTIRLTAASGESVNIIESYFKYARALPFYCLRNPVGYILNQFQLNIYPPGAWFQDFTGYWYRIYDEKCETIPATESTDLPAGAVVRAYANMPSPTAARLYLALIEARPGFAQLSDYEKGMNLHKRFKSRWQKVIRNIESDKRSSAPSTSDRYQERALWVFAAKGKKYPLVEPSRNVKYGDYREQVLLYLSAWFYYVDAPPVWHSIHAQEMCDGGLASIGTVPPVFHSVYHLGHFYVKSKSPGRLLRFGSKSACAPARQPPITGCTSTTTGNGS